MYLRFLNICSSLLLVMLVVSSTSQSEQLCTQRFAIKCRVDRFPNSSERENTKIVE